MEDILFNSILFSAFYVLYYKMFMPQTVTVTAAQTTPALAPVQTTSVTVKHLEAADTDQSISEHSAPTPVLQPSSTLNIPVVVHALAIASIPMEVGTASATEVDDCAARTETPKANAKRQNQSQRRTPTTKRTAA